MKHCALIIALFTLLAVAPAPAATTQQIDLAITKAKAFLYSRQNKAGTWETSSQPQRFRNGARGGARGGTDAAQWGGLTAMATYSLLAAGERPSDPRLLRAITFLKSVRFVGTYALSMRCQVWAMLPQDPDVRRHARADATALVAAMIDGGPGRGFYNYVGDPDSYPVEPGWWDLSNGQMAVLGVWAADLACYPQGAQIPLGYWRTIDQAWRAAQLQGGAWPYTMLGRGGVTGPRLSMTAAGVATLYITQNYLQREAGLACRGSFTDPVIDSAMNYVAERFNDFQDTYTTDCYTLYAMERIGAASGERYFNDIDWYRQGTQYLLAGQNPNGSWGPDDLATDQGQGFPHNPFQMPNTSFALIFLSRGRAPIAISKLKYGDPSTWNQRPRDVANVTFWLSKQLEMDLNWQTADLNEPLDDLHDSRILYAAGNGAITLTEPQEQRLRQFIEEGGLLLGNADCGGGDFSASFQALGERLFPSYRFRDLPKSNLIQTGEIFKPRQGRETIALRALSNGVRELMLLIPSADAARSWQAQAVLERPEQFQIMENILVYATDKLGGLYKKGGWRFPTVDQKIVAAANVSVARLRFSGNWDPEPAGWRRLAAVLHNENKIDLNVRTVDLDSAAIDPAFKLATLTGTGTLTLNPAARLALQNYVAGGGTLLIDAAGGDPDFANSTQKELTLLFPAAKAETIPWIASVGPIAYRDFQRGTPDQKNVDRLRELSINGRPAIYFSRQDISAGLVGAEIDGIRGYDPATATALVRQIILTLAPPPKSPAR